MFSIKFIFDEEWLEKQVMAVDPLLNEMREFLHDLDYVGMGGRTENSVEARAVCDESVKDVILAVKDYVRDILKEKNPYDYITLIGLENYEDKDAIERLMFDDEYEQKYREEQASEVFADLHKRLVELENKKWKTQVTVDDDDDDYYANLDVLQKYVLGVHPVKNSPEMTAYIKETDGVLKTLKEMSIPNSIFNHCLLVSIDEGWGYSGFLRAITRTFVHHDVISSNCIYNEQEIKIETSNEKERPYKDWENKVELIKEIEKRNKTRKDAFIIAFDISKWMNELDNPVILECLRKMWQYSKSFICVFKVPYMEPQVLRKIEDTLESVMAVKTVVVPPVSVGTMIGYVKERLGNYYCFVEEGCDVLLENLISQERQETRFFGYKTLDKLVDQMVYNKALLNCRKGTSDHKIDKEVLNSILYAQGKDIDPYEQLNELVGIAQVKAKIREVVAQIKRTKELNVQGKGVNRPSIHMIFSGNPGTGKTTVARILGEILKEEGVLSKGLFYEVQARSLCGDYIGSTAPKTSAYCRDAYGSVLFIDEAYGLYVKDSDKDYGKEAIQTLIAEMENHRDDFCVIMAGYKDEMESLMEINPGLRSRIPYTIEFPNYTREELVQIFFAMLAGTFAYEEELREAVEEFFDNIPDEKLENKTFSNARFVRNLYERVWGKAAYRSELNGEKEVKIQKADLIGASEEADFKKLIEDKQTKRPIGYRV